MAQFLFRRPSIALARPLLGGIKANTSTMTPWTNMFPGGTKGSTSTTPWTNTRGIYKGFGGWIERKQPPDIPGACEVEFNSMKKYCLNGYLFPDFWLVMDPYLVSTYAKILAWPVPNMNVLKFNCDASVRYSIKKAILGATARTKAIDTNDISLTKIICLLAISKEVEFSSSTSVLYYELCSILMILQKAGALGWPRSYQDVLIASDSLNGINLIISLIKKGLHEWDTLKYEILNREAEIDREPIEKMAQEIVNYMRFEWGAVQGCLESKFAHEYREINYLADYCAGTRGTTDLVRHVPRTRTFTTLLNKDTYGYYIRFPAEILKQILAGGNLANKKST